MPNINNQSFKISKWFCKVGEIIKEGEIICELENKKNIMEFESYNSGKLVSITNKTENLKCGDEIAKIEIN
jgi:pyruvate/2-oxoglutarate dehydrogenase complex dihydrolipoamide acyltransferase (E2) component